jgi:hypothetical protein
VKEKLTKDKKNKKETDKKRQRQFLATKFDPPIRQILSINPTPTLNKVCFQSRQVPEVRTRPIPEHPCSL